MRLLSERFEQALLYAHELHGDQYRKGTPVPYMAHLMGVASLVLEYGGDEEQAAGWLLRELHIVQPKLVVVMGEDALAFLNSVEFPLADTIEPRVGDLQRFTATIEALYVPDIDASLDEQPAKTRFWNAFKVLGSWWAELPPY